MPPPTPSASTTGATGTSAPPPTEDTSALAIDCRDLAVRYGTTTAVDGLSFSVHPGEVVALLGPNGAGKTTTLETIEGFRSPTAGTVRVCGLDPRRTHKAVVLRLGVMLQRGGIYPMLDPTRALRLFAAYYPEPETPAALLERLNLTAVARTPWRHLSGGEQARLSLALALIGRPNVLLLDEPTAGVDPEGRQVIRSVIDELRRRTAAVLVTTHALSEVELQADRIVIIREGRTVAAGTVAELSAALSPASAHTDRITFSSRPDLNVADLAHVLGTPVTEEAPGTYTYPTPAAGAANAAVGSTTAALASWLADHDAPLTALRTGRTLEEIYLEAVQGPTVARDNKEDGG